MGTRIALATVGAMMSVIFIESLPFVLGMIAIFPCSVFIATAFFYKKL